MQQTKSITVIQLKELMDNQSDFQLIDTREAYEHASFNIGGTLFPLAEITKHIAEIEKEKPVILYCRAGVRSQIAIQRLLQKFPFQNLYNLTGGTEAWKRTFEIR
ncbi:rhodanese-like domain-containing protein [Ferruginibacter paludis]|uniref:rhodanese-like domain-containing protein n=1 Tax=Ferruginibacter paludis TaxID=1310417 RepID=UPI0025B6235C|nr:rhodanese-like domain-containing protein [Ferruginibacter paludis]MDN3657758.1 rhodanese-like domain-containing protein [Ferruginibacter paludis]